VAALRWRAVRAADFEPFRQPRYPRTIRGSEALRRHLAVVLPFAKYSSVNSRTLACQPGAASRFALSRAVINQSVIDQAPQPYWCIASMTMSANANSVSDQRHAER
jgi:hypothetical protein